MSGLTITGFNTRRLADIVTAVRAEWQATLGAYVNTGADSVLGQILSGVAPEISLVWEGLAALYGAYDPAQATGEALDSIARLYGLQRQGPLRSTSILTIQGAPGTVIPLRSRVATSDGLVVVETTSIAVIPGSGVLSTLPVQAVEAGAALTASPNTLTQILTPVAGWDSVVSSSSLLGGRDSESDGRLRVRLAESTAVVSSVEGAIRTALLRIPELETALVISNRGLTTDANGTPGKSFRVVVAPDLTLDTGAEERIAEAIFRTQPAGIQAVGLGLNSRTATVVDLQGFSQTVSWEYPTILPVEYEATLVVDLSAGPLTSAEVLDLAYDALERWTNSLPLGRDVTRIDVQCVLKGAIPGLVDVTGLLINGSGGPVLALAFNERAVYNNLTSFVVVTP